MTPKKKPSKKELQQRIEGLEKELQSTAEQSAKYLNQLKYAKAEMENIQKQNRRRLSDIIERANGELLENLLPLLDELEILYSKDAGRQKLVQGVEMVPDSYIAEEIRRGYFFKDKVLRASIVKVARAPDVVEIKIEDNQVE
jgi:molecular chaperone GrpE